MCTGCLSATRGDLGDGRIGDGKSIYYDQIVKINYETGEYWRWSPEPAFSAFPGEAYFIPAPGAVAEDDGVLLTVVLDGKRAQSHLYVLNATTMQTIATVGPTPHFINHGFHGRFMPKGFNFN